MNQKPKKLPMTSLIYKLLSEHGPARARDIADVLGARLSSVRRIVSTERRCFQKLNEVIEGQHLYAIVEGATFDKLDRLVPPPESEAA